MLKNENHVCIGCTTLRTRRSGAGFKPPGGALVKSHGIEQSRKVSILRGKVRNKETSESKSSFEASKWKDEVKTEVFGEASG